MEGGEASNMHTTTITNRDDKRRLTHKGGKRGEWVGGLGNMACHKRGHLLERRMREEQVGELRNMACHK